jgi:simple sugar transport system permease protein
LGVGDSMASAQPLKADERIRRVAGWRRLLGRPELGAVAGTLLVYVFFLLVASASSPRSPPCS